MSADLLSVVAGYLRHDELRKTHKCFLKESAAELGEHTDPFDMRSACGTLGAASPVNEHELAHLVHAFLASNGCPKSALKFKKEQGLEDDSVRAYASDNSLPRVIRKLRKRTEQATLKPQPTANLRSKKEKKRKARTDEHLNAAAENTEAKSTHVQTNSSQESSKSTRHKKRKKDGASAANCSTDATTAESAKIDCGDEEARHSEENTTSLDNGKQNETQASEPPPAASEPQPKKLQNTFQRIDNEKWLAKANQPALADNSYRALAANSHAAKAAEVLGRVRGKNFRTEKNKKKRATQYGSGAIEYGVNSFKFDSD